MLIRNATIDDLDAVSSVEAQCFSAEEAATAEEFSQRLEYYGNHFWLMFDEERLIAFVDGFVTNEPDLTDEMYEKAMSSDAGRTHPYAVARAILNQADWEKYVWIEEHGSLEGFPK